MWVMWQPWGCPCLFFCFSFPVCLQGFGGNDWAHWGDLTHLSSLAQLYKRAAGPYSLSAPWPCYRPALASSRTTLILHPYTADTTDPQIMFVRCFCLVDICYKTVLTCSLCGNSSFIASVRQTVTDSNNSNSSCIKSMYVFGGLFMFLIWKIQLRATKMRLKLKR